MKQIDKKIKAEQKGSTGITAAKALEWEKHYSTHDAGTAAPACREVGHSHSGGGAARADTAAASVNRNGSKISGRETKIMFADTIVM